ncbi:serine/threonine-protein kinase [Polyangium sp. 6x1]|uniref:serine/threonine protein kinase n=1 Tax=Polyangium sp. 6x1 TaxID=3042689 RepID=UPI0024830C89|nr:serine/threonine-protein kinase [Polyangium sp. 6x1]MDI1450292.1 protein kinase [Polyangium sp. 6x1]
MSAGPLSPGSVFADRYEVVRCIATGGMGAVYEVVHAETQRHCALKVMLPHCIQSDQLRDRFRQEARVAANVQSQHIVDVLDAGIDAPSGMPFLVMELLSGEDLGKRVRRLGPLAPAEVVEHLHQTALALQKTHRAGIVHRDLKPDNLFLCMPDDGPPRIKVLDFGIAKILAASASQMGTTRSMGTPLYMAPEQFDEDSSVSPATDVFALGMIAYTLLCGIAYWYKETESGLNVFAFATKVCRGPQEAASTRAERVGIVLPPAFDAWFAKITAFAPEDRFPSATEAVQTLAEALGQPAPSFRTSTGAGETPLLAQMPLGPARLRLVPADRPALSKDAREAVTQTAPPAVTRAAPGGTAALPDKPPRRLRNATLIALSLLGASALAARAFLADPPTPPPAVATESAPPRGSTNPPIVDVSPLPAPVPSPIVPATAEAPPTASVVAAPSSTPTPSPTVRASSTKAPTRPPAAPASTSIYVRD